MKGVFRRQFPKWPFVLSACVLVAGVGTGLWWRWDRSDYEVAEWLEPNSGPDWWDDAVTIPLANLRNRLRFERLERRLARELDQLVLPGSQWEYHYHVGTNWTDIEGEGTITFLDDRVMKFTPPIEIGKEIRIPGWVAWERFGFGQILFRFEDVEYVGHFILDPDGNDPDAVTFEHDGLRIVAVRLEEEPGE